MTRPDLTQIYVLLDRSGSMQSIKDDIVGGFDAFVAEQRAATGECRMTLARFDNEYELVDQQTRDYGWQFLYMGADQDAVEVGSGLGIDAAHAMTWSRGSARAAMGATSALVSDLRRARATNPAAAMRAYTAAERQDAASE